MFAWSELTYKCRNLLVGCVKLTFGSALHMLVFYWSHRYTQRDQQEARAQSVDALRMVGAPLLQQHVRYAGFWCRFWCIRIACFLPCLTLTWALLYSLMRQNNSPEVYFQLRQYVLGSEMLGYCGAVLLPLFGFRRCIWYFSDGLAWESSRFMRTRSAGVRRLLNISSAPAEDRVPLPALQGTLPAPSAPPAHRVDAEQAFHHGWAERIQQDQPSVLHNHLTTDTTSQGPAADTANLRISEVAAPPNDTCHLQLGQTGTCDDNQQTVDIALSIAKRYAARGIEGVKRGHGLIVGDADKIMRVGHCQGHNDFGTEGQVVHIRDHEGQETIRRHMNLDGMIVIDASTGIVRANCVFANQLPASDGGARTSASKWFSSQVPGCTVFMISEDSKGEVLRFSGGQEEEIPADIAPGDGTKS